MRIVAFDKNGSHRIGVRRGGYVVDLSDAAPSLPKTLRGLLMNDLLDEARKAAEKASDESLLVLSELTLLPPVPDPPKFLCIGRNYAEHAKEGGAKISEYPDIFMRSRRSMVGPGAPIIRPKLSTNLDFEGELMAIIGKTVFRTNEAQALSSIAGYSIFNDVTLRDYQRRTSQWTMGKNFNGTGPFGPEFVSADELPTGCMGVQIQTRLNGSVMQNANTNDMLFPVATAITYLTQAMTLEPGDLIATGTPSGVGYARNPPLWMKPGDNIEVEIEGIGILSNPVVDEI